MPRGPAPQTPDSKSLHPATRAWLALAIGSLLVAGLLSLSVVIGRLPPFAAWVGDPLFFKRCLVVHVDLALVVWFYALVGALLCHAGGPALHRVGARLALVAGLGPLLMMAAALQPGAEPILANYVPVIDHPLYLLGLGCFWGGVLTLALLALLAPAPEVGNPLPAAARHGLRAAALAIILATATGISALAGLPPGLDTKTFYEFAFWGPGHVMQVANTAALLALWFWLGAEAFGSAVVRPRIAAGLFALLLLPHFVLPLLTSQGTLDGRYHTGATQLMRWGIFPVCLVALALLARAYWRSRTPESAAVEALRVGLLASAGLTLLGFILGACIRSSTTLVPAHYHAALGGVTAIFMTAAHHLVRAPESAPATAHARQARRQLALFGVGQTIFALGFALGGLHGLGRKTYGSEQHVRSIGEIAGLTVMGLGGLMAAAAGVWFLVLMGSRLRAWAPRPRSLFAKPKLT